MSPPMVPGCAPHQNPERSRVRGPRRLACRLFAVVMAALPAACDAPRENQAPREEPTDIRAPTTVEYEAFPSGGAETGGPGYIATDDLGRTRFPEADFERGELLSYACVACHTLGSGEGHLIGPNLHGIFGRPAASAPGFAYSEALRAAEFVWTPEKLDAWLARPDDFVPGNLMVFAGIYSISDRTDLLAYLLRETTAESSAVTQ